ncbi:hypothetical protein A3Q29_15650 [Providencia stuartii]|uniref:Uncharacterized protein n=1 Tax=Providencia stuartii TaxID=588 RepID=A0A1S1HRJ1_PROST|nr:hypothetical protein A3Q29_15650 [Providencia stuartii]
MADKHVGDGESQFKVVSSAPDVCKVGTSFIPFDSFQTLDSQKQYVLSVKARGHFTLNVGSIIKGTQSNAGSGIISGTSLGNGDCQIITGSPSVRIEGQPAAQHGSLTLMNDMNTLGNLQTKVDPPTNPIESNRIPCNNPPKTSRNLELLQILKEQEQASFIGRIRMKKQEIGHKLAQARDDLDKTADDRIDNIRVDHINTNYPWFDDMYNNNMDDLTGITRAGLGVLKDSVIGVSYLIDYHPANLYADSLLNNSVNTIDFLTTLEQWNLGNNCFEGLTEDAQKKSIA